MANLQAAQALLDLRPGHRLWPELPTPDDVELDFGDGLRYATQADEAQRVVPLENRQAVLDLMDSLLGPEDWLLFVDPSVERGPQGWYHALKEQLGLKLYRLTPESTKELEAYLEDKPQIKAVFLPQLAPDSGEALDVEDLFFRVHSLRPDVARISDISYSLGLLPYYHTQWQADLTLLARPGTGYWAIGQALLPPFLSEGDAPITLLPYLQYASQRRLPNLWNDVHREARAFRNFLSANGYSIVTQLTSDAITAFVPEAGLNNEQQNALLNHLHQEERILLGAGQSIYRNPCLLVQHCPGQETPVQQRLRKALENAAAPS